MDAEKTIKEKVEKQRKTQPKCDARSGNGTRATAVEGLNSFSLTPSAPKISSVILLTVCHTVLVMLVLRIRYWIN